MKLLMALISLISLSQLQSWDANYRKGDIDAITSSVEAPLHLEVNEETLIDGGSVAV